MRKGGRTGRKLGGDVVGGGGGGWGEGRTVTKFTRELYLNGYFTHELCRGKYAMVTHHPLKKRITEMK